jgi:hypothetical protein
MAKLRHHETIEEAVRYMEDQFDRLASECGPGDLVFALREEVLRLLEEEYPREVVLGGLDDYRHVLRDTGRGEYEDDVQDVMDLMTGFGPSRWRI